MAQAPGPDANRALPDSHVRAVYVIETPLDPAAVADVLAGEQSSGTFLRVAGESDALRARARAIVEQVEMLEPAATPSLPNAWLARKAIPGPWRRARITVAYPIANFGANLPTLAATVAGNLFDLGETTGVRLTSLALPPAYRDQFPHPAQGVSGTRRTTGVHGRPLIGTIIKPNVGMNAADTAALVAELCAAGIDFIKDDEVCADPAHAPLAQRVPAVMASVKRHQDRTGRTVMMAFNITDDIDAMRRHADLVEREGGTCVMASLNWCGLGAVQALRRSTPLALHGHRNGFGALSRHPALGIDIQAYQALYRLTGIDHLHVHGLDGKFADSNDEVLRAARACLAPLGRDDAVMPAFSSGQWAGTVPVTWNAARSSDLIFLAGGGILAHPDGPAAGVTALQQAWEGVMAGRSLAEQARSVPALQHALDFFGPRLA